MNYKEEIIKYIYEYEKGDPIFIEDIKKHIFNLYNEYNMIEKDKLNKNINVIINRIVKEDIIKMYAKGIYYQPIKNVFGEMPINKNKIIERKYLKDNNGRIKGYISGEKLFNRFGLTTQISNKLYIITNNCGKKNEYYNRFLNVLLKKSTIEINNENYLYLQLIDVLKNKKRIHVEANNADEIIYNYIEDNNLDFEKIIKYARETNNKKILEYLYEIAR